MEEVGKRILRENGASDTILFPLAIYITYRLGFHDRPWTSIHHLHLHCIGLPFKNCWAQFSHSPPFFVALDKVRKRIQYLCLLENMMELHTNNQEIASPSDINC